MQPLNRSVGTFAPEVETPINEGPVMLVHVGVFDDDCPSPIRLFAPVLISSHHVWVDERLTNAPRT
jgi:hypothetical protein